MDASKPRNETSNPAPNVAPTANPETPVLDLEGVQAIPMPPPSTSTPDLTSPPINRREYLARPKVGHIEDTLKRFDALLELKSKTNLQKLASEQRKARPVTMHHDSSCSSRPVPEVRQRPTSAMVGTEREQYYRALSEPKAYCLNDTLQRFGEVLEDSRRENLEENVGKLLSARESSTSKHLQNCPSKAALEKPAALGMPPPGYNALEVAKSSNIADPSIRILELTLEQFSSKMKPETRKELEQKFEELRAERDLKFKVHTESHARNDKEPEIEPMPSTFPANYDPVATAETSKLSWPNQHVQRDTLAKFGPMLKPEATKSMKERIQDQTLRRQATHKQHIHNCKLPKSPRSAHVRPSPDYDPVAVAKTSKISIPNKHVLKDTLDHYGNVIKSEALKNMQQMIKDRDLDRKSTHKQHNLNCKYMKKVRAAAPKRKPPPPGYNPAEVAKTSKVSRPNKHILKDTLAYYGEVLKPAARESMQQMIKDRDLERQTTHKQHLKDCTLETPPRARDVRPSPDYDPVEVSKTSKIARPNKHILQDTLDHYGPILKPTVRKSMQRMVEALDADRKSTHQRHAKNCLYMADVLTATPPSFPPPPGYNTDEVTKESKIAQPYRHRLQDTLNRHGHALPERAKQYLLKILEDQRQLREVSTRCHRKTCHLPEPPEPRVVHHAYSEKNIVAVIEKFKAKLKREAFDHLTDNVLAHLPDLVLATDIAKLAKLDPERQRLINVLYSTVASYNGKPLTAHDHELYVHLGTGLASFMWDVIDSVQREKDAAADKKEESPPSRKEVHEPKSNSMTTEIFGHLARDIALAQGDRNVLKKSNNLGDPLKKDQAVPSV